jgi:hypothetical protein
MSVIMRLRLTKRILGFCVSLYLVLGSILPAVAAGCEGGVLGGELVYESKENPFAVTHGAAPGFETKVEYKEDLVFGAIESGALTISGITVNGFTDGGSTCGVSLKNGQTCKIKINCTKIGGTGTAVVESKEPLITAATRAIKCV